MSEGDLIVSDWKSRHPFKLGAYVWAKQTVHGITPLLARKIYMRGESERGLWIAFAGVAYEFSVDDFVLAKDAEPEAQTDTDVEAA